MAAGDGLSREASPDVGGAAGDRPSARPVVIFDVARFMA